MAVIAKQRYKLDIAPKGGWVIVYASQHDDGAREIEFEITNQGNAFSIPASINVSVQGIKSNKSYFSHSCSYSGNVVTMALADDMTDVIGKAICVLKFTNSSQQKLATAKFILNVDSDSSSEGVIIDTEAEEIFNQMLDEIRAQAASVSADIAELQSMVGSPLVASTASRMTNHNKIYVYTGSESGYINGNWYYWNGSAWTSGGVYNSNAFETDKTLSVENMPADAKVVGGKISELKEDLGYKLLTLNDVLVNNNAYIKPSNGSTTSSQNYNYSDFLAVKANDVIKAGLSGTGTVAVLAFYTTNNVSGFQESVVGEGATNLKKISYTAPTDGYVRICNNKNQTSGYFYVNGNVPDEIKINLEVIDSQVAELTDKSINNTGKITALDSVVFGESDTSDLFEIGSITFSTSGWTYSAATKRIRTREGVKIWLTPGDTIKLSDYSNARFSYGAETPAGKYIAGNWRQEDYTVIQAGYYGICISNSPEVVISSVDNLISLLSIIRCRSLENRSMVGNANVIGVNHRGYNLIAPENTLPAFILSKKMGFDWIETDISFTSDNVPVLLHDDSIDRTSNGSGSIGSMTYDQVREYDFGSWKNAEYAGTKIPSLEELLLLCKRIGLRAYLELKTYGSSEANIKACANLVKKYGLADKMVWISFTKTLLQYIAEVIPEATLIYIRSTINDADITDAVSLKASGNTVYISAPPAQFTDTIVDTLIVNDIKANSYTVNTFLSLVELNNYVESVTTDVINVAEALLVHGF